MKSSIILMGCLAVLCSSCMRTGRDTWEDTKTCGRYFNKGMRSLLGYHEDGAGLNRFSRWSDDGEFIADRVATTPDFVPMEGFEQGGCLSVHEFCPPAHHSPGDPASPIPGIASFKTPSGSLATLFSHIHFGTDQYSVVGNENVHAVHEIARHLIAHPELYVFVEGHADERGAAAYNLALGSKRANSVRAALIENGVNPDQLFTISYGKEQPIALGHGSQDWEQNRRAQFKIYEQS